MVTIVYRMITKPGKEEAFKKVAIQCTQCARKNHDCIRYSFFRALDNPREFLVYYRFKDLQAQDRHIANLRQILGPSPTKRDLPKKFLDLLDEEEVILFDRGE